MNRSIKRLTHVAPMIATLLGITLSTTAVVAQTTQRPIEAVKQQKADFVLAGLPKLPQKPTSNGGNLLPPTAQPQGYSLERMLVELAKFNDTCNDKQYFPKTPFQILYLEIDDRARCKGPSENTFTVKPGTTLFLLLGYVNDSPPIPGVFPQDSSQLKDYIFGQDQLGISYEVEIDGKRTLINADNNSGYVVGPAHLSELLPNGGSNVIQFGAFLSPLTPGIHRIVCRVTYSGLALGPEPSQSEFSYTVIVK